VDGFDDSPRLLMTYNPRRYQQYVEAAGYEKAMDLWAYSLNLRSVDGVVALPAKVNRVADRVRQRANIRLRQVNMKRFDDEVAAIKSIYNESWPTTGGSSR